MDEEKHEAHDEPDDGDRVEDALEEAEEHRMARAC
jgi:hypothetical protein